MNTPRDSRIVFDKRFHAAWILLPLLTIPIWKSAAVLIVPAIYAAFLLAGLPALFILASRKWLGWGHSSIAGFVIGLGVALLYAVIVDPFHASIEGPRISVLLPSIGVVFGASFWIVAVCKNRNYFHQSSNPIFPLILVATVTAASWAWISRLQVTEEFGRLISDETLPVVTVALENGVTVYAKSPGTTYLSAARSYSQVGVYTRIASFSGERLYWANGVCKALSGDLKPCSNSQ